MVCVIEKIDSKRAPDSCRGAERVENHNLAAAFRAYVNEPEAGADQLLREMDPTIRKAVTTSAKGKLSPSVWEDVAQETRLHLICGEFLLRARRLVGRKRPQERTENPSPNESKRNAALARRIKNRIYMVAAWKVHNFVRHTLRYERMLAAFAGETNGDLHLDQLPHSLQLAHQLRRVRTCLSRLGYDKRERALLLRYFRGEITQRKLGQGLGLAQSATCKRVAELKRGFAFIKVVAAAKNSPAPERDW